ncbi:uncharacterized protein [Haliotis asinina]|uniref:uncharacterized protein isoform X2 n=1 Tax=Haliotis asinina TaxID=109174 RepID=UPI003531C289
MYSAERMSETGKQLATPDVPEDEEEVALALEHSQKQIEKPHHTIAEYGQLLTQVTTGASGGYMRGSNVAGIHFGDALVLNVQYGNTSEELEVVKGRLKEFETTILPLISAQSVPSPAPLNIKKQGLESEEDNTDERITGVFQGEHDDGSEMTDDELYIHLHECDVNDVSDEDIQYLTDEQVYNYVIYVLSCCNIRTSEQTDGSDTVGIKTKVKARQHIHKEDPLSAGTEETISDVKLKSSIKGGDRFSNPGIDLSDGVNSEKVMGVRTAEDRGRKQLDATYAETLLEDHSKADSGQNAVYSEGLREGRAKGDNPNMKGDLLTPSPVDPLIGLPGNYLEFTFDLRCIPSGPVRVITRHNVEKTVEIGKLHPMENVTEVFTFLDAMLTELCPQSDIRFEPGFYASHPVTVSEVIRIDLRDIQNIVVRVKTKLNVELILQISAMKPPSAWFQKIETFLSRMLLKDY